jgi:hypothetical protein
MLLHLVEAGKEVVAKTGKDRGPGMESSELVVERDRFDEGQGKPSTKSGQHHHKEQTQWVSCGASKGRSANPRQKQRGQCCRQGQLRG